MFEQSDLLARAQQYAKSKQMSLRVEHPLGYGSDGTVWQTSARSAVKSLEKEKNYLDEITCYRRLRRAGIENICGLAVPILIDSDDTLLIIEMSLVRPPFLLDFGKVYIDRPPPYWADKQLMANFHAEGRENFQKHWSIVQRALAFLRSHGIYYVDPRPGNIVFEDDG